MQHIYVCVPRGVLSTVISCPRAEERCRRSLSVSGGAFCLKDVADESCGDDRNVGLDAGFRLEPRVRGLEELADMINGCAAFLSEGLYDVLVAADAGWITDCGHRASRFAEMFELPGRAGW